jgi:exonuclease SbcC
MQILNVRFKNINTLKGEWEIHFDRPPLREAGLFAITGPNGSGKSNIFDAISLGLYGEMVRLKNSSEQIVSKKTSECYSTVTFSVGGDVFRSTWSLHLDDGNPLAPEMSLVQLNGTEHVLANNMVAVRSCITELTGLDYKRFSRSVMLAQGEFAAFLNALDYERVEILEKIAGHDMYSNVVEEVVKNAETEDNKLTALKEEIQNFPLMPPSEVKALEDTAEQLEDDFRETERTLSIFNEKKEQIRLVNQLKDEYDKNQMGLAEARGQKEQMQSDLLRLKKAMDAAPFEKDIDRFNRHKEKTSEYLNTLNTLKAETTDLENRLEALEATDRKQALEAERNQNVQNEHRRLIEKTLEIDREIQTLSALLQTLNERRSSLENRLQMNVQNQQTTRRQLAENEALLANTETWLEAHAADENLAGNIAGSKDALGQLKSIRNDLSEHSVQQISARKAEKKASTLLAKAKRKTEKLNNKADKLSARQAELKKMQASLLAGASPATLDKTLEDQKKQRMYFQSMLKRCKTYDRQEKGDGNALELALKAAEQQHGDLLNCLEQEQNILYGVNNIARLEPCRKQLKKKEACPLCGSLDHPYADREPPFEKDPAEVVRDQEHRIESLKHQIKIFSDQIAGLKNRYDRFSETRRRWSLLSRATGTEWPLGDRSSVTQAIRALKKDVRKQQGRIKRIRKLSKKTEKLDRALQKKSVKTNETQQAADQLQNDVNRCGKNLAAIEQEIRTARQKEADLVQNLNDSLQVFKLAIPTPGKESELIGRLEKIGLDYRSHVNNRRELNEQILALKNKAGSLPVECDRLKKEIKDVEGQIETEQEALHTLKIKREKTFGTGDALQEKKEAEKTLLGEQEKREAIQQETRQVRQTLSEKQNLKQTTEKIWQDAQNECEQLEQKILSEAASSGFSTLEEIHKSLLSPEQRQALIQKPEVVDSEIIRYTKNLENIRKEIDTEDLKGIADQASEDLSLKIQDLRKQKDQLAQEISAAFERLEHYQILEKEYQQKTQELEQQENLCNRLNEEKRFFETAGQAEVKTRIQELMLERLLEHSNKHLESLSSRYYLRRREMNGLGLEIEDLLHSARRTVNTLSGGESFLVSLSMALGLSDMSGNGRKIESLFVDEGFGSLDDETLYKVLSTLKDLKNNGKMVGVISHVKKVEDEISTKIRLTRMPGGVSRLDVVA